MKSIRQFITVLLGLLLLLTNACSTATQVAETEVAPIETQAVPAPTEVEPEVTEAPSAIETTSTAPAEPVELEYLTIQYSPEVLDVIRESLASFEASHPNIKVTLTEVPFEHLFETIDINLSSGEAVMDLFSADAPIVPKYAYQGAILSLDDFYTDDELSDFLAGDMIEASFQDKFFAIPQHTSSQVIYYNIDLFENAGLEMPPTDPEDRWTWEEVVEVAKKLTIDGNGDGIPEQWGLVIEQDDRPYQLYPLIQSNGGLVISEDGTTVEGYINSPEAVEAMTFYQNLYGEYGVSPKERIPSAFETGKAAMMLGGTWHVGTFRAQFPDLHWSVTPHPYFDTPITPCGSFHLAVNAHTAHQVEAIELAKWVTGVDVSVKFNTEGGEIPSRHSAFEELSENFSDLPNSLFLYELENTCVPRPRSAGYQAMEDILIDAFRDIINGADVQETLDSASTQVDEVLADFQ